MKTATPTFKKTGAAISPRNHERDENVSSTPAKEGHISVMGPAKLLSSSSADPGNFTVRVMEMAYCIIRKVRTESPKLLPMRLICPIPGHGGIMRPVDLGRSARMSLAMVRGDIRANEPIVINDALPSLSIPRHPLSGNHRACSCRDSGSSIIVGHVIEEADLMRMVEVIQDCGRAYPSKRHAMCASFKFLMIALQTRDPSPVGMTAINQVTMIRTFFEAEKCDERKRSGRSIGINNARSFGGFYGLRGLMFPGDVGDISSQRHFLLNNSFNLRNGNRVLKGARAIITIELPFAIEYEGRKGFLDMLIMWEHLGCMPSF